MNWVLKTEYVCLSCGCSEIVYGDDDRPKVWHFDRSRKSRCCGSDVQKKTIWVPVPEGCLEVQDEREEDGWQSTLIQSGIPMVAC